ncbi:MAG: hypothetical protein JWL89_278 [Candidatus Saccharibacteria bacterium]|jgi:hypothetical protein|nr:hypothetical protein [Candidatus Saccharibacteria bacterium]
MTISHFENPEIQITAVSFRAGPGDKRFESFPRRMVYDGREYTFIEQGMRYLVQKGQQFVKLFDVSDGQTQYRLRQDSDNSWSLVNMKAMA